MADRDVAKRGRELVDRGLDFLSRSQQSDGRWRLGAFAGATAADIPKLESDTAATGLALLCFLGAGHDHFEGPYRDTVRRGLEFLIAVQRPDGDLFLRADDLSNSCAWLYSHGIASMALCEAVGMTGDPLVKPAAERACAFIAASQHPQLGGWRYTPRSDADLSVSGWMLVAMRAGDLAGLKTDPEVLPGVKKLLDASASREDATRYAYNSRKQDQRRSRLSLACMTAVGGLMRLHTGDPPGDDRVVAAGRALAEVEPAYGSSSDKLRDAYLWYYASQVLVHTGGADWDRWYGRLVEVLADRQEPSGPKAGSWDPLGPVPDRWGEYGGRIYVTALHLLAVEVPDRHLPTYSAGKADSPTKADRP
ncbi:MAG: prenyltransferase/squalene oxidase repeat-containing protein [Pirellulales bacterium]